MIDPVEVKSLLESVLDYHLNEGATAPYGTPKELKGDIEKNASGGELKSKETKGTGKDALIKAIKGQKGVAGWVEFNGEFLLGWCKTKTGLVTRLSRGTQGFDPNRTYSSFDKSFQPYVDKFIVTSAGKDIKGNFPGEFVIRTNMIYMCADDAGFAEEAANASWKYVSVS